jgi:hypothetical protein
MRRLFHAALAAFAILCVPHAAGAQSTSGTISGTVTDESKGVLPGVAIEVVNADTGVTRSLVTGPDGRYQALSLPPGTYRVTAELSGFGKVQRDALVVTIGGEIVEDIRLKVGGITEVVSVSAERTTVGLGSAVVGGVVTTTQIAELPLNGRSFMQLATLQPGVSVSRTTERDFTGGFGGTQVSIGGARPEQTGYLMDGTNISDMGDKAPSSVAGVLLGVDTVQEFSVQTHGYSAEYGRAAGGVISAVTKSGTNKFRGSAFEFHRNSAFDKKGFFDAGDGPPDFVRNQFGGTLGGPLVRNRLFFFGSYEGLREKLGTTRFARVPNALAHQGFVPDGTGGVKFVGVAAGIKPYLDLLYPLPNGQDFGDGSAEYAHAPTSPTVQNLGVGKIDWNPNSKDAFLVRVSNDTSHNQVWQDNPNFTDVTRTETRYSTVQWQRVFSAGLLNQVRGAFNRTFRELTPTALIDVPKSLYFVPDMFGVIEMPGILSQAGNVDDPAQYNQNLIQVSDTLTKNAGRHTVKSGFDYQHYNFYGYSHSRLGGTYRFRTMEEMLTLRRSATAQADRFLGNFPGTDTQRDMNQGYASFFVHDDFRVSNSLTLSLGLRYEFVTTPEEKNGKVAGLLRLEDLESGPLGITKGSPPFDNPSKRHGLAPRLGFSWLPFGANRTTIRGGGGIFNQPLTVSFYRGTTFRQYPYFVGVDLRQPAVFGPGIQGILAGGVSTAVQKRSEFIFYDTKQPYNAQWYLNTQQELPGGMVAEVGYLGSRGVNLPYYGDPNSRPTEYLADGTKRVVPGSALRYPSWGRIRTRRTGAESEYNGLTLGLQKRFERGFQFQGNYTLAKSTDTWSGGLQGSSDYATGAGSAVDWWDIGFERGPSSFDVRHNFVFNAVYLVPWGAKLTGVKGVFAKGWQFSGVASVSSGLPFHPVIGFDRAGDGQSDTDMQRPSWAPGRNASNAITGDVNQWFDPTAFVLPAAGTFGNVTRNSLRGPNLRVVDASVFKNQKLGPTSVQLRLEIFNLFNRNNFAPPSDNIVLFASDGSRVGGAGRITSLVTPARQIQLGAKILF